MLDGKREGNGSRVTSLT